MAYKFPDVYIERILSPKPVNIGSSGEYIGGLIGRAERGEVNKPILISSWSEYIENFAKGMYSPFIADSYLAYAVYGFFQNGGGSLYVCNSSDGKTAKTATATVGGATFTAVEEGDWGNKIYVGVETTDVDGEFNVPLYYGDTVSEDTLITTFKNVKVDNIIDKINGANDYVTVTLNAETPTLEAGDTVALSGGVAAKADLKLSLEAFDNVDDIAMLSYVDSGTKTDNDTLVEYCTSRGSKFAQDAIHAVLNVSSEVITPEEVENDTPKNGRCNMYYPWVSIVDPLTNSVRNVPNCGHVQGMIIRMTNTYGLSKVPAGINASLGGVVGLATSLSKVKAGNLNDTNVCCIIEKPNYGIVSWGGRSRFEDGRYITSCLLETKISRDLYRGMQPYVFEPNNSTTWRAVTNSLTLYLKGLWERKALDGNSTSEAFSVICDATTNTPEVISAKELRARVAYHEPDCAEFIIVELSREMQ